MATINEKMTAIADAIRSKTGETGKLSLDAMAGAINNLEAAGLNFNVIGGTSEPADPVENTIWVNTDVDISSWDFSATQPCRRSGNKNLSVYPYIYTTMTEAGVTFTDNQDGTITVNGTATEDKLFRLQGSTDPAEHILLDAGTYTISDAAGSSAGRLEILVSYDGGETWSTVATCTSGAKTFTITQSARARMNLKVYSGNTFNNVLFKPQLEKGSTATSYVKGDATGQVWFTTGIDSLIEFNALQKNGIQVYPLDAKQYVGGTFVDVTVKSYQNGEWVSWWSGELFVGGDTWDSITGGWIGDGALSFSSRPYSHAGSVTETELSFSINAQDKHTNLVTKNEVDLTKFSYLDITVSSFSGSGTGYAFFYKKGTTTLTATSSWKSTGDFRIAVPSGGGKYRVGFSIASSGSSRSMKISEARLVK